jgi:hypothetical protein
MRSIRFSLITSLGLLMGSLTCVAHAAERYTEARITQVETGEIYVSLFLSVVSGDAPPVGNGGSNEPVTKPFLVLANSATDIANRKHMLSAALLAYAQGSVLRFRWEDTDSRIMVMLTRAQ